MKRAGSSEAEKVGLTTERTILELSRIACADPSRLYRSDGSPIPLHELDDDTRAAVASVEIDKSGKTRVRLWSRAKARQMLMRHLGLREKDLQGVGT